MGKAVRVTAIAIGAIIALAALAIATLYLWPQKTKSLQHGSGRAYTYSQSIDAFNKLQAQEAADTTIRPECRSLLLDHLAPPSTRRQPNGISVTTSSTLQAQIPTAMPPTFIRDTSSFTKAPSSAKKNISH